MKKLYFIGICLFVCSVCTFGCKPHNQPIDITSDTTNVVLEELVTSVPISDDWIYETRPNITLHVKNKNSQSVDAQLILRITTDQKKPVETIEQTISINAKSSKDISLSSQQDLEPGFYKAFCYVNGKLIRQFCFGVSPFQIVSAPDMQPDFDAFWSTAKQQLAAVEMQAELTEIPAKSNSTCKVYLVEMYSIADGLSGDPVVIRGYYLEPQDGQPHPVLMHFFGYDTSVNPPKLSCPSANSGQYAEFYLSHRGQQINNRTADKREYDGKGDFVNQYGDWFAYNFGNKDAYYYRGAFMDAVQAVRFMATRPTSDMNNLFAEGSSQGGALCYAAAALSDIPFVAIAPNVAFLGDFPDYFNIVSWPGFVAKANQGTMSDEEMYAFLSYFDTKNLATKIHCAVYATSGLQDGTCPPHTNIAPYNNLAGNDKQMTFYPEMQHAYPATWIQDYLKFFKERMKYSKTN